MSVDIIKEPHKIKVRKPHICQGCGKTIQIKEEAISSTFADRGDIWTFYECLDCADYRNKICNSCKDYEYCIGEDYYIGVIKTCKIESSK